MIFSWCFLRFWLMNWQKGFLFFFDYFMCFFMAHFMFFLWFVSAHIALIKPFKHFKKVRKCSLKNKVFIKKHKHLWKNMIFVMKVLWFSMFCRNHQKSVKKTLKRSETFITIDDFALKILWIFHFCRNHKKKSSNFQINHKHGGKCFFLKIYDFPFFVEIIKIS